MSSKLDRIVELGTKGVAQLRRELRIADEQVAARVLSRSVEQWLAAHQPSASKHVVILSPRSWAAHVQWEAVIAQALRLRGVKVTFLTCGGGLEICDRANSWESPPMPCRTCDSYVRDSLDAHGLPHVSLKSFGFDADAWPELDAVSREQLQEAAWDGLPIGKLTDIPVKWFLLGATMQNDPLEPMTRRRFARSGRVVAGALTRALDELRPDVLLMLNGLFFFESIALEIARQRGIDAVSYERGFIHDTLFFLRGPAAASYRIDDLWNQWSATPTTEAQRERIDRYLQSRRTGDSMFVRYSEDGQPTVERPTDGRLAVVFTNITWDSAVIGRELGFTGLHDWLIACVDAFAARPDHRLVVRVHPAEVKLRGRESREPVEAFLRERYPELPANVTVISATDPTSSYALMDMADVGLVYTSTAGLEMALAGTPVVVAAETHYRGKGFTVDVEDRVGFEHALDAALADPTSLRPDVEMARRYAFTFFFRSLVPSRWVREPVKGLAELAVTDAAALAPGADSSIDRICDGLLNGDDFSTPEGFE